MICWKRRFHGRSKKAQWRVCFPSPFVSQTVLSRALQAQATDNFFVLLDGKGQKDKDQLAEPEQRYFADEEFTETK